MNKLILSWKIIFINWMSWYFWSLYFYVFWGVFLSIAERVQVIDIKFCYTFMYNLIYWRELFLFTRWVSMNALTFDLVVIISWMNILHAVTSAKRETAPQIRKLKSSCGGGSECPVSFPKAELKKRLTPIEYHVTQERGTEK